MITASDIQKRRSPRALRDFVIHLKDSVKASKEELRSGILKSGLYKEFLDEIVPLSVFALQIYPEDSQIQPVLGNQGYDALVFDREGREVDRVEITSPHDGNSEAKDATLVVDQGVGELHFGQPGDELDALIPYVLGTCRKKAEKDYRDCTLVVAIEPTTPIMSFHAKHEQQLALITTGMTQIKFKAKRVFLVLLPDRVLAVHQ